MLVRGSFRSAYAVFGVFFAVAVVSTTALGWLVSEQFRHDAVVDAQRQREQLIQAADATVGSMQRALFEIEALVRAGDVTLASVPRGVSLVMLGNDSATVNPRGSLLFMPVRGAASREAPTHLFAPAERLEFGERRPDLSATLHTYSKVARRTRSAPSRSCGAWRSEAPTREGFPSRSMATAVLSVLT